MSRQGRLLFRCRLAHAVVHHEPFPLPSVYNTKGMRLSLALLWPLLRFSQIGKAYSSQVRKDYLGGVDTS